MTLLEVARVSNEAVQAILERTISDEAFRSQLFQRPDEALANYELTPSEADALRSLCVDQDETDATSLDQRQSKSRPFWLTQL